MKPNSYCRQAVCWTTVQSLWPQVVLAQGVSPWLDEVMAIEAFFNGPIARGLWIFAIVIGALIFAFGEGGAKRTLVKILIGVGITMGLADFLV